MSNPFADGLVPRVRWYHSAEVKACVGAVALARGYTDEGVVILVNDYCPLGVGGHDVAPEAVARAFVRDREAQAIGRAVRHARALP